MKAIDSATSIIRGIAVLAIAVVAIGGIRVAAQSAPTISIVSPSNDTVVQPGQTVQLTVAASSGVIGEEILLGSQLASSAQSAAPTVVFSLAVPSNIQPGRYFVVASGGIVGGGTVQSAPLSLVVPSVGTNVITRFRQTGPIILRYPGQRLPIDTIAMTGQGSLSINSPVLTYSSANPAIASVNGIGLVTAQAPGQTSITITAPNGSDGVSMAVNVQVLGGMQGDLNGDGKVDITDLNILNSALNRPANGSNDARDLNHDGKIDALDARILTTLCTYPRCATHP